MRKIKLFLIVFAALNLVFLYYQKTFFIGNHDWDWVKGTTQVLQLNTGLFEGRYAKFILNAMLFGGQILPWLNTVLAFALLAAGMVMLVGYWQVQGKAAQILAALLPALAPFILGWLYFPINILGNFMLVPLVAGGLILAERAGVIAKFAAVVCFLLALGVYPSAAEMMCVCLAFRYIIMPPARLKDILPPVLTVIISLVAFKLLLAALVSAGFIYTGHYNVQSAAPDVLIARLPQTVALAFSQLWTTLPFFSAPLKFCGLVLVAVAATTSVYSAKSRLFAAVLWLAALAATVLSAFLAATPAEAAYMPRINFYGLNFLYAGSAAVLLTQPLCRRNLGFALSLLYLFWAVNENLYAQKVWQFGKTAEENLVERVSARIESRSPASPLIPVIAGEFSLRPRYYQDHYMQNSPYLLEKSFIVRHIPSGMFNFYAPVLLFSGNSQISRLTPELAAFLQTAAQPYPAEQAVFVDDAYAVILLTPAGIAAIKAQLPK